MAPQTVHTMRGPKDGTAMSSAKASTHRLVVAPNRAAGDCQRAHAVFTHVAEGHHFTASLKKSLNMLTTRKMITSNNKMPAVIARMRNHFSRLPAINPACAMSALGHKRTFAVQTGMSALPPKADKL